MKWHTGTDELRNAMAKRFERERLSAKGRDFALWAVRVVVSLLLLLAVLLLYGVIR